MEPTHQPTDAELLRRFCDSQDQGAFALLVQRHQGLVFAVCRAVLGAASEAEDAAQATFLVLAQKAAGLRQQPSVGGWLHRVAWNMATRAARDARLRQQREQEAADMMAMAEQGQPIPRDQLHEALASLPDKYRQALVLRHLEGCSEEQTAQLSGCGVGAVSARLSRARELLRQKLLRRGVGVASAGALVAALSAEAQAAAVPATFAAVTAQVATGAAGAGVISAGATVLVQGALHMLWVAKLKLAALVVVLATLLAGGGTITIVKLIAWHQANLTRQVRGALQQLYNLEAQVALPTRVLELPANPFPVPEAQPRQALAVTKTIEQIRRAGDRVVVIVADQTRWPSVPVQVVRTEETWQLQGDGQWRKILVRPLLERKQPS